jgi:hypothetical protein
VTTGHLALKRAIRHAEANDLVARNVAALADTPKGQQGRPSKSLTLDQAVAVITAAATVPVMELRPGLKDVRRPAALMHAYIVLSLLAGIAPRKPGPCAGPTSTWTATRPPARPSAARGRLAIGPHPRRDQDRTIPPRPRPPRGSSPGAARLDRQPGRRTARGRGDGAEMSRFRVLRVWCRGLARVRYRLVDRYLECVTLSGAGSGRSDLVGAGSWEHVCWLIC